VFSGFAITGGGKQKTHRRCSAVGLSKFSFCLPELNREPTTEGDGLVAKRNAVTPCHGRHVINANALAVGYEHWERRVPAEAFVGNENIGGHFQPRDLTMVITVLQVAFDARFGCSVAALCFPTLREDALLAQPDRARDF
jgi:hypothetical protein